MAAQFTENTIKLEENSENVTEIQSYLAGFQKEIGSEANIQHVAGKQTFDYFHLPKTKSD